MGGAGPVVPGRVDHPRRPAAHRGGAGLDVPDRTLGTGADRGESGRQAAGPAAPDLNLNPRLWITVCAPLCITLWITNSWRGSGTAQPSGRRRTPPAAGPAARRPRWPTGVPRRTPPPPSQGRPAATRVRP